VDPLFVCLGASGDCLVATDPQTLATTLTWDSGAHLEGTVGLAAFRAFGPGGGVCFDKQVAGGAIALLSGGRTYQVTRHPEGGVTITCPDGAREEHAAGSTVAGQPGIDPARLTGCRVQGMCSRDQDCGQGSRCCQGTCHAGALCPGECLTDEDCGANLRCCDGLCFSTPICNLPCFTDADCEDGVYCNGAGRCEGYRCTLPLPVDCDDGVACTVDACDEAGRRCQHTPQDALCGADEICFPEEGGCRAVVRCSTPADCANTDACLDPACVEGICRYSPVPGCCNLDADCADGLACNGEERCALAEHTCLPGQAPDCQDAVDCTQDACDDRQGGCVHVPDSSRCTAPQVCDRVQGCVDAPACLEDAYEENDLQADATELPNMSPLQAILCPGDPGDWFVLTGSAGEDVSLVIAWPPGQPEPVIAVHAEPPWPLVEPAEAQGENQRVIIGESLNKEVDFFVHATNPTSLECRYIVIGVHQE